MKQPICPDCGGMLDYKGSSLFTRCFECKKRFYVDGWGKITPARREAAVMPTQHQPPGIQETIAGMLPFGIDLRMDKDDPSELWLSDSYLYIDGDIHIQWIDDGPQERGWHVYLGDISSLDFMLNFHDVKILTSLLQSAFSIVAWLNEHWKPGSE